MQFRNLLNLEIALRILGILKLRTNLEIAQIPKLHGTYIFVLASFPSFPPLMSSEFLLLIHSLSQAEREANETTYAFVRDE